MPIICRRGDTMRYLVRNLAMVALAGLGLCNVAAAQDLTPIFLRGSCDLPDSAAVAGRLRCGIVRVPRDHTRPEVGTFALAIVVIASEQQPALPEPVVYISGGPGEPLTVYAAAQARKAYAPRRDLILVDQRGTGRSEPSICPDHEQALFEANLAYAAQNSPDTVAGHRAAYMGCRDEAIGRGLDLTQFGTSVTAADLEWVRRALGIARWNVFGESYGTSVAMTLAALHPETIRSLVLDSIYPPEPMRLWSENVREARETFFAHCAQDAACAASFPDLAGVYREALSRLAQEPLSVELPAQLRQYGDRAQVTADLLEILVSRMLYFPPSYPMLPRVITSVREGDAGGLGRIVAAEIAAARTQSRAAHAAVECRDRPHFRAPVPAGADALDRIQLYGICVNWAELGPTPPVPTGTRVPTLVLAGEFDPVARPPQYRRVTDMLGPAAHLVVFPRLGHNIRQFSPCGTAIAAGFIDDPDRMPDTSCVDRRPPIAFAAKSQDR
jgi:pimeloyl-ACP methyl ester carboxylesterase